jgi:hypothetical protein
MLKEGKWFYSNGPSSDPVYVLGFAPPSSGFRVELDGVELTPDRNGLWWSFLTKDSKQVKVIGGRDMSTFSLADALATPPSTTSHTPRCESVVPEPLPPEGPSARSTQGEPASSNVPPPISLVAPACGTDLATAQTTMQVQAP